jgi:DNA-binding transcriptional regulator YiaG
MANHPNRGRAKSSASNPTPEQLKDARKTAGLTQTQAAEIIYASLRAMQQWEAGERRMHPGLFELLLIKTGQKDT